MSKYAITAGVQDSPVKTVLYGPEGIGKSTFASHFPNPVFIDTEGGTKRLNVKRLPQPTSWAMLLDEVAEVRKGSIPCGTLVIDTADWAERLAIDAVCAKAKVDGLEGFGYGKGYTYLKEEFGKLLDALEEVLNTGHNVLILAHAAITKFEQPDAAGSYDRWTMKTTKQVEPLIREWCDMLLLPRPDAGRLCAALAASRGRDLTGRCSAHRQDGRRDPHRKLAAVALPADRGAAQRRGEAAGEVHRQERGRHPQAAFAGRHRSHGAGGHHLLPLRQRAAAL